MHELAYKSIQECDDDIKADFYGNIILSGGSTLYEGLPDRLEKEMNAKVQKPGMIKVLAFQDRHYSEWTGGSILCSLSTFESQWITMDEYEENGAEIVHRKCIWATFV